MEKQAKISSIENFEIYHLIQPVVNLINKQVLGFEFLLRSNVMEQPESLFKYAAEKGILLDLDLKSVEKVFQVIEQNSTLLKGLTVFVNVFPSTLLSDDFHLFIEKGMNKLAVNPKQIVLEINESETKTDTLALKETVQWLRKKEIRISLDDIGKGESTLKNIIEIEPDISKIDSYFSQNLSTHQKKQETVKHLVKLLKKDSLVILEGLETEKDLQTAKKLGITYAQGYHLGKPKNINHYL
ncbi:EAL domain-containing protein [Bacillus kwashiorkori]|uniref:EAL domain-containing protein n=1 Tax=Bacillus kwashiorkori TaxID=1522318 RepID=UPI000782D12F|nr:EAL domain-containing protein [Bacillus kwashiorkori]